MGSDGLRAGWRLLIFLGLVGLSFGGLFLVARALGVGPSPDRGQLTVTPLLLGENEAVSILILGVITWLMAKIERRKFSDYGLPIRQAMRKDFWVGTLYGFSAISGTLLVMFLLRGFHITGLALHGIAILYSLAGWGIAFLLVGIFEELAFRGYVQFTLATGIGFWPAAWLFSSLFGLGHYIGNPKETIIGSLGVVPFGLLLCLFLWRTGNLWLAIGFHAGYDWGQMFYGVPDSSIPPYHNLLSSAFSGPNWLTGGIIGPEGSVLTPIALLVVALVFNHYYRGNRYQISGPRPNAHQNLDKGTIQPEPSKVAIDDSQA